MGPPPQVQCLLSLHAQQIQRDQQHGEQRAHVALVLLVRVGQHPCYEELSTTSTMVKLFLWSHE